MKKHNKNGDVTWYKAQLVTQGFLQIPGIDYHKTFAPVVWIDSLRATVALSAINNLEIRQVDIKGAYLNEELEEEIYMYQPEGFDDGTGWVYLLKKTLYGLKQSAQRWNKQLQRVLAKYGFHHTEVDHSVYVHRDDENYSILLVWVDDIFIVSSTTQEADKITSVLKSELEVHNMGEPKLFLGTELTRDQENRLITLSQKNYIETILQHFKTENCATAPTPLNPNVILNKCKDKEPSDKIASGLYTVAIGSLMYAAMATCCGYAM